jgi:hypothetical protein
MACSPRSGLDAWCGRCGRTGLGLPIRRHREQPALRNVSERSGEHGNRHGRTACLEAIHGRRIATRWCSNWKGLRRQRTDRVSRGPALGERSCPMKRNSFQLTRTIDPCRPVGSIKQLWVAKLLTSTHCDDGGPDVRELEPCCGVAQASRRSQKSCLGSRIDVRHPDITDIVPPGEINKLPVSSGAHDPERSSPAAQVRERPRLPRFYRRGP